MTIPPTVKLWGGYGIPTLSPSGLKGAYSLEYMADRLSMVIAGSRSRDAENQALISKGYSGPWACYCISHAQDPATGSLYGNQLVMHPDEFKSLPLGAFLHSGPERTAATRIWWDGGGGRKYYKLDPASGSHRNLAVHTYAYTLNEYGYYTMMFPDNVGEYLNSPNCYPGTKDVVWPGKPKNSDGSYKDVPYTPQGYIHHEKAYYQHLRDKVTPLVVKGDRTDFVMCGNMLWRNSASKHTDWPMFNGFLHEYETGWHNSGHNASVDEMLDKIDGALAWLADPSKFLLTTQQLILSDATDLEKIPQTEALVVYGLAMALMMAPEVNQVTYNGVSFPRWQFRPAHSGGYLRWFEFPQLNINLGAPVAPPTKDGSFRSRTFERGVAQFNPTGDLLHGLPARSGRITKVLPIDPPPVEPPVEPPIEPPVEPPPEEPDVPPPEGPPPIVVETEDTTVTVTVEIDPKDDSA